MTNLAAPRPLLRRLAASALALGLVAVAPGAFAEPMDAKCDTAHSRIGFVAHTKLFDAEGTFKTISVKGTIDPDKLEASRATVTVDVTTLDTASGPRDKHLRSEDFFHVEKFPQATYVVTKIEPKGGDKYLVTGDLTIRGVKKTVTAPATITRGELKAGQPVVNVKTQFIVNWKEFGMPWKGAFYAPDIREDIDVVVELNFPEPKPAAPAP